MGGADSKIQTSNISLSSLKTGEPIPGIKFAPPLRAFGELFRKRNAHNRQYLVSVKEPYAESIAVNTAVFEELKEAFHNKTEHIIIENVINDDQVKQRWVFGTIDGTRKQSLVIRPFSSDDSHMYANILCEVHYTQLIAKGNSQFLHKMEDNYVVQTGIDSLDDPNSHILAMERVDANLTQIINFRRKNKWDWTVHEFERFVLDLISGLQDLHKLDIFHNDIRASNIYFSIKNNSYAIGNFASCEKGDPSHGIKLAQKDISSLGRTLLSAFYLCPHLDQNLASKQNKLLEQKYEVLKVIALMEQGRPLSQIRSKLRDTTFHYADMDKLIDSMHHRERPSPEDTAATKLASGWAYQRLGLWNEWKKEYEEALELSQHKSTPAGKANSLLQLAVIDHSRGQHETSSNYAKNAAGIYRGLAAAELQMGVHGAAQSYYKKAIGCSKYYQFVNDIDLSRSLQGISNVHAERNEYRLARTLAATASNVASKSNGKDSFEWAEIRVHEAKLETDFGAFKESNQILDECLGVADKKQGINPQKSQLLRAKVYAEKGRNLLKWAENAQNEAERTKMLDEANGDLIKGVNIYQGIEDDHHLELANIVRQLGEVQFKRQSYDEAIQDYDRSLNLINFVEVASKKRIKQHGDLLCLKGSANSFKGNASDALANYQNALQIYRQIYGSDHNRQSAVAIGNLGRVYVNAGEQESAKDCLSACCDILREIGGQQDADYLHFKAVQSNIKQYVPS